VTTIKGYVRNILGAAVTQVAGAWLEVVGRNRISMVTGLRKELVGGIKLIKAKQLTVSCGAALIHNTAAESVDCGGSRSDAAEGPFTLTAGGGLTVKAKSITIEAKDDLSLKAGAVSFKLSKAGEVEISAPTVDLSGVEELSQMMHKSN
jgi:hypothetical protein